MPARSRTSSQKRQKELARMEKQKEKAARRAQRKLERLEGTPESGDVEYGEIAAGGSGSGEFAKPADEVTGMAE